MSTQILTKTMLGEREEHYLTIFWVTGQLIGLILGFNLFVPLNSEEFMANHFGYEGKLLTFAFLYNAIAVMSVLLTVYIVFFVAEDIYSDSMTIKESYHTIVKISRNSS